MSGAHSDNSKRGAHCLVVLLVDFPPSARDVNRFGVAELRAAGLRVAFWDASPLFLLDPRVCGEALEGVEVLRLHTRRSIRRAASKLTHRDTVTLIGGVQEHQERRAKYLLKVLGKRGIELHGMTAGDLAVTEGEVEVLGMSIIDRAKRHFLKYRHIKSLTRIILDRVYFYLPKGLRVLHQRSTPRLKIVWGATTTGTIRESLLNDQTQLVRIHALDYDEVLKAKIKPEQMQRPAVYIDNLGSRDWIALGQKQHLSRKEYAALVLHGIEAVERSLGVNVSIAGHPGAEPGLLEHLYQGREVISGKTDVLIRDAGIVICSNASRANTWTIAFRKPLILMNSSRFHPAQQFLTKSLAAETGCGVIDLDTPQMTEWLYQIDMAKYEAYLRKYIKLPGTPDQPFWQVVAESIASRPQMNLAASTPG